MEKEGRYRPPEITKSKETDLTGKVAIVTGSSHGIGRTIALKLAFHGADIVINSTEHSISEAEEVKLEIEKMGRTAIIVTGDISKKETAEKIAAKAKEKFNHIDILVNNAGTTRDNHTVKMTEDEWDTVMKINLKSAFFMTQAVLPQMSKQRSGKIINIASIIGEIGKAGQANYAASKAGLIGLTKSIALEYATRGLTANCVAPGFVRTPLTDNSVTEKQKEEILKQTPMNREILSEEIADAVLFLASDRSSAITAQTINVDGGIVRT